MASQALVEYGGGYSNFSNGPMGITTSSKKENIRVAIRVRPLLSNEFHREEVVYYPTFEDGPL